MRSEVVPGLERHRLPDLLADRFADHLDQRLPRARQHKCPARVFPIELETFGMRRHPHLPHRTVRADDELSRRRIELDRQRTGIEISGLAGYGFERRKRSGRGDSRVCAESGSASARPRRIVEDV